MVKPEVRLGVGRENRKEGGWRGTVKYGKADLGQMEEWPPGARHQTAVESPAVGIQWLWKGTLGWR